MTDTANELLALADKLQRICIVDGMGLDAYIARMRAIAERLEYRPLDEAPKDGTQILMYWKKDGFTPKHFAVSWSEEDDDWLIVNGTYYRPIDGQLWCHIPTPP